jgi:predicted dehydrogenase
VRIVALCDVDQTFVDREARPFKDRGEEVATHTDLRRIFDDKSIDAVVIALPNHWHALATVWACQAGKDVYVEKPFSYNLWEGQQMVAAARKYGRMVQVGTQNRSSTLLRQTFEYLRGGGLGPIRYAHALVYRARDGPDLWVSAEVDQCRWPHTLEHFQCLWRRGKVGYQRPR